MNELSTGCLEPLCEHHCLIRINSVNLVPHFFYRLKRIHTSAIDLKSPGVASVWEWYKLLLSFRVTDIV